jgi:hypothetical protein
MKMLYCNNSQPGEKAALADNMKTEKNTEQRPWKTFN